MKPNQHSDETTGFAEQYIGHYKLVGEIAPDHARRVFEAVDPLKKNRVAIKHLQWEGDNRGELETTLFAAAETLASLDHPHIAKFLGFVRQKDQLYLVTEFVEGESLHTLLKRKGGLEPSAALAIFHEILSAVGFAHQRGVIHGGVRPSNIMLTKLGVTKVLNFAIGPISADAGHDRSRDSNAAYAAPEQFCGGSLDARSDVYSLGVLLYEMIVGSVPFGGVSDAETLRAKIEITPLRPSMVVPETPSWLDGFLMRALAPSPFNRFESVAAMLQAISTRHASTPDSASPAHAVKFRAVYRKLSSSAYSLALGARRRLASLPTRLSRRYLSPGIVWLRRFITAQKPRPWITANTDWLRRHVRQLRLSVSHFGARKIPSGKETLVAAQESGWKRHAVLALLLGAVMIEIFFFAGANTLLRPAGTQPAGSYDNAVDQLFGQIDKPPREDNARAPVENAPALGTPAARQPVRLPQKSAIVDAPPLPPVGKPATDPRRVSNARIAPEPPAQRSALQEPPRQPLTSRAPLERNPARIQLNVQWEN